MKRQLILAVLLAGGSARLAAQQPAAAADSLRAALARVSARLDSLAAGLCPAGPSIVIPAAASPDSLARLVAALNARLDQLVATRCPSAGAAPAAPAQDDLAAIRAAAAAAAGAPSDTGAIKPDTTPASTQFIGKQRNASALNPEISATGDIRLVARSNSQRSNGVDREFEIAFQSALDPYSNTKVFLTFEQDEIGVEEGYIYWTGLPGRLRLDVGKIRQEVGDLNRWHLHALPESEYPLVYRRYLGPEGLSGAGLSLYTTLPVSLARGTHEVWVQGTTTRAEGLVAGSTQPVLLGRLRNFWQLDRSTYAQLGFTAAGGNNADSAMTSRLLGLDFRLTWRPPSEGTRRELTFRAEGYRLHTNEAGITTNRYGAFAGLIFRASQRWILGARYDYVQTPRGPKSSEWRITPSITWWESEFVYLRLEGEHKDRDQLGASNQLLLQAVWAMGPHKHETY
jgi:hypothetical protein